MDDKHIDATHAQHVPITRAQVENLGQQFRQHATTWPGVPIPFQQYFSQKAQAAIEDYILLKDIVNVGDVWTKPWPILIDVLRQMYPESTVTEKDAITLSKIALIDFMIDNISNDTSWHKWKPTSKETLVSQQMSLLRAARKIFEEQGVPRENHGELLTNPALLGGECVKAFQSKLRARNTPWDHDLSMLLQQRQEAIRPINLSLMDLQRIVADKIQTFDTMKNSYEAAAPYAATGKSSSSVAQIHKVDVNAIVQNSNTQEKPYQGTIRKDMTRPRSESVERPMVDYTNH